MIPFLSDRWFPFNFHRGKTAALSTARFKMLIKFLKNIFCLGKFIFNIV